MSEYVKLNKYHCHEPTIELFVELGYPNGCNLNYQQILSMKMLGYMELNGIDSLDKLTVKQIKEVLASTKATMDEED